MESSQSEATERIRFETETVNKNLHQLKSLLSNQKQSNRRNRSEISPDPHTASKQTPPRSPQKRNISPTKSYGLEQRKERLLHSLKSIKKPDLSESESRILNIKRHIQDASPNKFKAITTSHNSDLNTLQSAAHIFHNRQIDVNVTIQKLVEQNISLTEVLSERQIQCKYLQTKSEHLESHLQEVKKAKQLHEEQCHQRILEKSQEVEAMKEKYEDLMLLAKRATTNVAVELTSRIEKIEVGLFKKLLHFEDRLQQLNRVYLKAAKEKIQLQKLLFPTNSKNDPLFHRKTKHSIEDLKPSVIKGDTNEEFEQNCVCHEREVEEIEHQNQKIQQEFRNQYEENIRFYEKKFNDLLSGYLELKNQNTILSREIQIARIRQEDHLQSPVLQSRNQFRRSPNRAAVIKRQQFSPSPSPSQIKSSRIMQESKSPISKFNYFRSNISEGLKKMQSVNIQTELEPNENLASTFVNDSKESNDKRLEKQHQYFEEIHHIKKLLATIESEKKFGQNQAERSESSRVVTPREQLKMIIDEGKRRENDRKGLYVRSHSKSRVSNSKHVSREHKVSPNLGYLSKVENLAKKERKEKQIVAVHAEKVEKQLAYEKLKNQQLEELVANLSRESRSQEKLVKTIEREQIKESLDEHSLQKSDSFALLEEDKNSPRKIEELIFGQEEQRRSKVSEGSQRKSPNSIESHQVKSQIQSSNHPGIRWQSSVKNTLNDAIYKLEELERGIKAQKASEPQVITHQTQYVNERKPVDANVHFAKSSQSVHAEPHPISSPPLFISAPETPANNQSTEGHLNQHQTVLHSTKTQPAEAGSSPFRKSPIFSMKKQENPHYQEPAIGRSRSRSKTPLKGSLSLVTPSIAAKKSEGSSRRKMNLI